MDGWSAVACTSLKTQFAGRTDADPANGNGVVAWLDAGWTRGSGTIGTTTARGGRNCITTHMALNGMNFRWVVGRPMRGEVNAFSILAHEGGHYFGLGHTNVAGALMLPRYGGGEIPIGPDDQEGICRIYPGGGGGTVTPIDCTMRPCPTGLMCIAGVCRGPDGGVVDSGSAGGGTDGGRDTQAGGSPDGPRDTRFPDVGIPLSSPPRDAGPPPAPAPLPVALADGQPCDTGEDCRSNLCLDTNGRSICSRICANDLECFNGFVCRQVMGEGLCLPVAGSGGSTAAADAGTKPSGDAGSSTPGAPAGAPAMQAKAKDDGGCSSVPGRPDPGTAPWSALAALCLALLLSPAARRRRTAHRPSAGFARNPSGFRLQASGFRFFGRERPPMSLFIPHVSGLADEDMDALVAFLKSIPPVKKQIPERALKPEFEKTLN
jgi:hypothetical protein